MAAGFQYSENSAFSPVSFEIYDYAPIAPSHQQSSIIQQSSISNSLLGETAGFPTHHHYSALAEYELTRHNQSLIEHWLNTAVAHQSPTYECPGPSPYTNNNNNNNNNNNDNPYFTYPPYLQECLVNAGCEPGFIRKRNERERMRVRNVNEGYARLRDHLPLEPTEKRLSKVETLRGAIKYIRLLQTVLRDTDSSTSSSTFSLTSSNRNYKDTIMMTSTMPIKRLTSDRRSDGELDDLDLSR